jgi:hypothetical protein
MTSAARVPPHVPTLTEVVSWTDGATPAAWQSPEVLPPDLAREVEARVMHQIQQLLPSLIAQAVKESLQSAALKVADN